MGREYAFGDSDVAAKRLRLLAEVFAASSKPFLHETAAGKPRLALDLGCGPGFSTHLVAEAAGAELTIGLDNSERFMSQAQETATERVRFIQHDVTKVPMPVKPADLIFVRFLLTHLKEPGAVIGRWGTQLQPGGLLLLEEVDAIHAHNPTFEAYVGIVEAMLASQSNNLYVGRELDGLDDISGLARRSSRVRRLPVATARAAQMFRLNIRSWKDQPFVRDNYPEALIEKLQSKLDRLAQSESDKVGIEWDLRQVVLEQPGTG